MLLLVAIMAVVSSETIFKNFLRGGRLAVKSSRCPLCLCIGNEAADADSIVSSLCYGFFKQVTSKEASNVVPLVDTSREVLALRPETELLLKPSNARWCYHRRDPAGRADALEPHAGARSAGGDA